MAAAFAGAALLLVLVPAASAAQGQAQYPDAAGDGSAPDVTGVTVASDYGWGAVSVELGVREVAGGAGDDFTRSKAVARPATASSASAAATRPVLDGKRYRSPRPR